MVLIGSNQFEGEILTDRLAFTIRLEGEAKAKYLRYKKTLEKEVPNVSHSQTMGKIILDLVPSEVC